MDHRTFLADLDDARVWRRRPICDPVAVREWAEPLLARAWKVAAYHREPIPCAGTDEWAALDDRDPRKPAAVVQAALAALGEATPHAIAARVAADWAAAQREFRARLKEASADLAGAQDWGKVAGHVPFCVYAARRTTYATPPRTADEIRTQAAVSWAAAESAGRIGREAA